jgi:hypothetical protein
MAPQIKVLAAKPGGLSSISGTHMPSLLLPGTGLSCVPVLSKQTSDQTVLPSPSENPHSPPGLQSDLAGRSRESVRLLVTFSR